MHLRVIRTEGEDIALVLAWPESWSKAPEPIFKLMEKVGFLKSRFFQAGHAAVVLIEGKTGNVEYFDFGRYTSDKGKGRVRSMKSDPKLEMSVTGRFDNNGKLKNLSEILVHIDSMPDETHGDGRMYVSVCKDFDFETCKSFVEGLQSMGSVDYRSFLPNSTNCAQFVADAMVAGVTCRKTKNRLRFPFTLLRATPIGNVEAISTPQNYIVSEGEITVKDRINRLQVFWLFFTGMLKNITGKNLTGRFPDNLETPIRHRNISLEAQWLRGLGEGTWLTLLPFDGEDSRYRILGQSATGQVEYDYLADSGGDEIDFDQPYQFVYDCSRMWATVMQNNRKIIFKFQMDIAALRQTKSVLFRTYSK